ncbi:hypothetical protein PHYC_02688 [Phycisphaerales bacterium]|nr:hypothetical protein PHYC_02688 [Phycisphaerales bacterium]
MLRSTLRWTLILACLFALGPAVYSLLLRVHDAEGGRAVTLLINADASRAAVGGLCAFVVAGAVGLVGARFFSIGTGFLCSGIVLAWARWGLGTLDDLARISGHPMHTATRAIENAAAVAITLLLACVMVVISARRQPKGSPGAPGEGLLGVAVLGDGPRAAALGGGFAIGLVAAGAVAWLMGSSDLRGQALMAALLGALVCGAVGQLVASSMRCSLTPVVPVLVLLVLGIAGPLLAQMTHGSRLVDLIYQNEVFGLARPVSLDWAAGALLGGPIGLGWAGAMLDVRAAED